MPNILTPAQIAAYETEGYLAPVKVMDEADAVKLRGKLETLEAGMGGPLRGDIRHKAHLLFPFLADLVRHPAILDAIEDVLGPDLLCWNTNFFIKEADTPPLSPGTRIRPIGVCPRPMSAPPGWR
jgi:non-heme Fe2+,alpha-ketoglutarate-dependent halogenase